MPKSFFFYDLETSGLSARTQRIMQFGGQRTDMNLQPIGEPVDVLIKLSDDILPEPHAVLITGITPQQTLQDGISEPDFAKQLSETIATPDTVMVGFNNVRFDDEFVRHTLWRNFYDPYEWAYKDGRSRWDMLDVVRLTRALRPDGIQWPIDSEGKPTNRLELVAAANGLNHQKAHDALSDVQALIGVARLVRDRQPKLFDYLLTMRDKKAVTGLVNLENPQPFVYASGRYDTEFHKTTVAYPIAAGSKPGSVLVYDLRYDPKSYVDLSQKDIKKHLFASWEARKSDRHVHIPIKELQYNRCPAVAPLGVLNEGDGWQRVGLSQEVITEHIKQLTGAPSFVAALAAANNGRSEYAKNSDVESQLYDSFMPGSDKGRVAAVRSASPSELADFTPDFADPRLPELLLRYKARNYPQILTGEQRTQWEAYRTAKLQSDLPKFAGTLTTLATQKNSQQDQFLLQELQLWAEGIAPISD